MPMNKHWRDWVKENIKRGCSTTEIHDILVKHKFPAHQIKQAMGKHFPGPKPHAQMDDAWRGWIKENIERGSSTVEIHNILVGHNFLPADIKKEMGANFPHIGVHVLDPALYDDLTKINITRIAQKFETDKLQLYTLENFMTPQECEQLIAISSERLRPSAVARQELYTDFRTSSTCDLSLISHPLVKTIGDRIGATLGLNPSYSEGIQVQRYEVGQYFKPHMDYFEPHTEDYDKYANVRGNRTWTFMVYLNETAKGGGTGFQTLGHTFFPKIGTAVIWNNLLADGKPNPNTLHSGEPIEEGNKIIITDWYRELGTGTMIVE